jgi:hypothetical protein
MTISASAKSMCYVVEFKKNKAGHKFFKTQIPTLKAQETNFTFMTKNKKYSTSFYCMKNRDHYECVGDDDSGKYKIYKDYITLYSFTLGHPDKDLNEIRFNQPQKMSYKKKNCN